MTENQVLTTTVQRNYHITRPNQIHSVQRDKVLGEKGQNNDSTGLILTKITFFCTTILHALIDNAVQCNSGEGGMWKILMVTNMESLPEKS